MKPNRKQGAPFVHIDREDDGKLTGDRPWLQSMLLDEITEYMRESAVGAIIEDIEVDDTRITFTLNLGLATDEMFHAIKQRVETYKQANDVYD